MPSNHLILCHPLLLLSSVFSSVRVFSNELALLLLLLLLSHFSHVRLTLCKTLCKPTRLPRPWDSPGKNTGVSCHFLFQCMKVKSESEVTQLCPTLSDPMDCSPPGSSVHGIFQARVLEWGAIAFSVRANLKALSFGGVSSSTSGNYAMSHLFLSCSHCLLFKLGYCNLLSL